jgi:hypothetical protein
MAFELGKGRPLDEADLRKRARLDFVGAVLREFAFLETAGFAIVASEPTIVRYRRGSLGLTIFHGRMSYEIDLEVYRGERHESGMGHIIGVTDREAGWQYKSYQTTTQDGVRDGVALLAGLFRRYGARVMIDDPSFFRELVQVKESALARWTMDMAEERLRPQANAAFKRGDYAASAELYEQFKQRLRPSEAKKLELAQRRDRRSK